jgi:hypothetical protein
MKRMTAVALLVLLTTPALASALGGDKAAYVGGTIARFNMPSRRIEGRVDIRPRHFVFVPENGLHAAEPLSIDYESIRHLEFGQRTSRRVPLLVTAAAVLGPLGLVSLSAKSRAHDLTLTYAGELGRTEVMVIELGKHVVRRWRSLKRGRGSRSSTRTKRRGRGGADIRSSRATGARFCCPAPSCGGIAAARASSDPAVPLPASGSSCPGADPARLDGRLLRDRSVKQRSRSSPGCARPSGAMTESFPARRSRPGEEGRLW